MIHNLKDILEDTSRLERANAANKQILLSAIDDASMLTKQEFTSRMWLGACRIVMWYLPEIKPEVIAKLAVHSRELSDDAHGNMSAKLAFKFTLSSLDEGTHPTPNWLLDAIIGNAYGVNKATSFATNNLEFSKSSELAKQLIRLDAANVRIKMAHMDIPHINGALANLMHIGGDESVAAASCLLNITGHGFTEAVSRKQNIYRHAYPESYLDDLSAGQLINVTVNFLNKRHDLNLWPKMQAVIDRYATEVAFHLHHAHHRVKFLVPYEKIEEALAIAVPNMGDVLLKPETGKMLGKEGRQIFIRFADPETRDKLLICWKDARKQALEADMGI